MKEMATNFVDKIFNFLENILEKVWGRLLAVILFPLWIILLIILITVLIFSFTMLMIVHDWIWKPMIELISWICYRDKLVLGRLYEVNFYEYNSKYRTYEQSKALLKRDVELARLKAGLSSSYTGKENV